MPYLKAMEVEKKLNIAVICKQIKTPQSRAMCRAAKKTALRNSVRNKNTKTHRLSIFLN